MYTDDKKRIIPLLNDIASRLWDGHAAVLVGAGFSRNAKPTSNRARSFPMWNDFGDIFYEKIYCEKNTSRYSNVLKLGDEVQAAFGRNVLERIIKENIPDEEYEPSLLHITLLNLPWVDVFTTNYDTLLERTCVSVESRKYDFVLNKNDLMNAEKPRIIKLHGSLPSERPFIMTEEDYRRYPTDFSPFVNTVQQSLIENTLCLIGFSGDDPNFLSWIGWIRDNLGSENAPKIFLVGLFSFNEAQRKLLERRNIVIVDISLLGDFKGNHYKAHESFFKYLNDKKKEGVNVEWPDLEYIGLPSIKSSQEEKEKEVLSVINAWRNDREKFPNWCIVPENKRRTLWRRTERWMNYISEFSFLNERKEMEIAYELVWRVNKSLMPLFDNVAVYVSNLIEKNKKDFSEYDGDKNDIYYDISEIFPFLIINLLKYYRQEGVPDKWLSLSKIIINKKHVLSPELYAEFEYENALFSYSQLDIDEVVNKLSRWERNLQLPFHEAKRAGLLAELGMVDESISILESSLSTIRRNSLINTFGYDFSNLSQEAYIIFIIRFLKNSLWREDEDEKSNFYTERLAILSQYGCEPINELKFFEIRLEYNLKDEDSSAEDEFDLGRRRQTQSFGFSVWDDIAIYSYNFFLFVEEIGMPLRIPNKLTISKKTVINAATNIYSYSPEWAMLSLMRFSDEKSIGRIYNRYHLSKMDRNKVNEIIDKYFIKLKSIHDKTSTGIESSKGFHLEKCLLRIIPELLSRLVTKCSFEKKKEILIFLCDIFNSNDFHEYACVKNLVKRTIGSLSSEQKIELIPLFIKFPILPNGDEMRRRYDFINPFELLVEGTKKERRNNKIKIPKVTLNGDIVNINSENVLLRRMASLRMIVLYDLGFVDSPKIDKMIKAIWSRTDSFGLPEETDYYKFYFVKHLYPKGLNVRDMMIEYIRTYDFPVQSKNKDKGVNITNGRSYYCRELIGSLEFIEFPLGDIDTLVKELEGWYYSDRKLLFENKKFKDIKNEFIKRFSNIIDILINICLYQKITNYKDTKERILYLLNEMKSDGFIVIPALLSLSLDDKEMFRDILASIEDNLHSSDEDIIVGVIRSLYILLRKGKLSDSLLRAIGEKIKWNHEPYLIECMNLSSDILHENIPLIGDGFIGSLLSGLQKMHREDENFEIKSDVYLSNLEKRVSAAKLAFQISKYLSNKNEYVPEIIYEWRRVCTSSEEFDEIKNVWLD
ncbi:SIR2 family protein [Pectobacterium aroidearum]|uniref:SIR2 family protein n=1 Tax=Pectobacterium aroidearum TaxID=1201031 RepID=A0ABR5ZFR9_9GAMM|nr:MULTISPECIES: anti-phage defense-associated sirtuin Dsr2 [Pectobacterium]MBA5200580.1 SIR2 family protein [Pectobacterium aroidearum]MBA5228963.1 SIR2 family protein [Pectobacterium aroidearum]MBA5233372.1 SIR2 family protein [Pectobacterium aroidearum]MBA5738616.1 SIR2 family protein [Pectobacterium aroidearum]UXK00815.1 SIR2 family protein [Pectobacterium aroidearum]